MATGQPAPSRVNAPAKINLCLNITGRRADGYHLLDSVVVFAATGDFLDIRHSEEDCITLAGAFASQVYETQDRGPQAASDGGGNICAKTLSAWRAAGGAIGPLAIHIEKHIPVGAGLGGGSGDAAALLRWLQTHADRPIADDQLFDLALEIGADVPACLVGKPLRMRGIGDVIETLEPAPAGPVLLASPGVLLSTKRVFTALADKDAERDDTGRDDTGRDDNGPASWPLPAGPEGLTMAEIASRGNDLQAEAIAIAPEIGALLQLMAAQDGAVTAQMTGSGSACFALFETSALCDAAEAALKSRGLWAVSTSI